MSSLCNIVTIVEVVVIVNVVVIVDVVISIFVACLPCEKVTNLSLLAIFVPFLSSE